METKEKEFEGLKNAILERAKEDLEAIDIFPHDFNSNIHEIIHEELDSFVCGFDRLECLRWIDFCNNEEYIDKGVIDDSNIDRLLVTTAYECIHLKLFDDDLIYDLQEYELTEGKKKKLIKRINERLKGSKKVKYKDNETQIFIKFDFRLSVDDFKEPYFSKDQIIKLHDGIKILTNRNKINRNAIVIEGLDREIKRIYLMDKSKGVDIREFFRPRSIKDADYDLRPQTYMEGVKKEFKDKKEFIWRINQMANKLWEID